MKQSVALVIFAGMATYLARFLPLQLASRRSHSDRARQSPTWARHIGTGAVAAIFATTLPGITSSGAAADLIPTAAGCVAIWLTKRWRRDSLLLPMATGVLCFAATASLASTPLSQLLLR